MVSKQVLMFKQYYKEMIHTEQCFRCPKNNVLTH